MGCNCKSGRKVLGQIDVDYTQEELDKVYQLSQQDYIDPDDIDILFDVHNRIFIRKKEYKKYDDEVINNVKRRIIAFYESK